MTALQASELHRNIAEIAACFERIVTMKADPVAPVEAAVIDEFPETDGVIYV